MFKSKETFHPLLFPGILLAHSLNDHQNKCNKSIFFSLKRHFTKTKPRYISGIKYLHVVNTDNH